MLFLFSILGLVIKIFWPHMCCMFLSWQNQLKVSSKRCIKIRNLEDDMVFWYWFWLTRFYNNCAWFSSILYKVWMFFCLFIIEFRYFVVWLRAFAKGNQKSLFQWLNLSFFFVKNVFFCVSNQPPGHHIFFLESKHNTIGFSSQLVQSATRYTTHKHTFLQLP